MARRASAAGSVSGASVGVTAATLFVYRRRDTAGGARYRAPFYPASVVLFCAACLYVVAGAIASNPWNAARSIR